MSVRPTKGVATATGVLPPTAGRVLPAGRAPVSAASKVSFAANAAAALSMAVAGLGCGANVVQDVTNTGNPDVCVTQEDGAPGNKTYKQGQKDVVLAARRLNTDKCPDATHEYLEELTTQISGGNPSDYNLRIPELSLVASQSVLLPSDSSKVALWQPDFPLSIPAGGFITLVGDIPPNAPCDKSIAVFMEMQVLHNDPAQVSYSPARPTDMAFGTIVGVECP